MHDAHDDTQQTPDSAGWFSGPRRSAMVAVACLACFAAAIFAMQALTPGAKLIVDADESATALINAGRVKLHQENGGIVQRLIVGRQSMRAGKYRIQSDSENVRLEFSTSETFEIHKGQILTMTVTSHHEEVPDETTSD